MPPPDALKTLFDADPKRGERYCLRVGPLFADFSRQPLGAAGLEAMLSEARRRELPAAIDALFAGQVVNATELRPALHWALRADDSDLPEPAMGQERRRWRERMAAMSSQLRAGEWQGASGAPVTDVVCIGIGGSELGPRLVVEALGDETTRPRLHFIANVDGHPLARLMARLDPARSLLLVTSKSFGTAETLADARTLLGWLEEGMPDVASDVLAQRHLIAVTARTDRSAEFGIPEANILPMWDSVGGRYSLWSAVGLPIMLALGENKFKELLAGARQMDQHFRDTSLEKNLPVLLGLLDYRRFNSGQNGWGVVPYDERLALLPEYLQQLVMESLGKSVSAGGQALSDFHPPIVFGATGTRAQHAFFQALHQGKINACVDFIGVIKPNHDLTEHHQTLLANLLAQATALAFGTEHTSPYSDGIENAPPSEGGGSARALSKARDGGVSTPEAGYSTSPHRTCPGNRPSNIILLDTLTPESIGALLALYEHRVYVAAVMAGINPFDQFGVELGKGLAKEIKLKFRNSGDSILNSILRD